MKKFVFALVLILTVSFAFAENVKFIASAPTIVGVGQSFQVKYTLNSKGSNIKLSDYPNFKFVNGPSIGTSHSTHFANGKSTTTYTYTYTYVLQAKEVGTFTIPAAKVTIDGKEYTSNTPSITVQKDPVQNNSNRNAQNYDPWADFYNMMGYNTNNSNTQPKEITNEDLFLRIVVDKTSLYKGERITAVLKIYTKVDILGYEANKLPAFDSFYAENISSNERPQVVDETYNGQNYKSVELARYILYPRVTGDVVIEACNIKCQYRQINGRYYQNAIKNLITPEIKIKVNNLPSAPDSFTGAVGSFNISLEKSGDTVLVNDAVSIKFTIKGSGNFNMIETPKISWPKEFEVYEPQASDNINTNGINGSKTWEYTIIPRYPGIFDLGKISFTYFDTNTKQYKTLQTKDISLAVKKDANDTDFGENSYNNSQTNVEYIGEDDIVFVNHDDLNLKKNYVPLIKNGLYGFYFSIPLILFIIVVIILRKKIKENANIAAMREKKAGKVSMKRLKKARKLMTNNQKEEFYKEIISALWGYSSDKLNIQAADLTKDRIIKELESKNVSNDNILNLITVIDKCEYAHFAPDSQETELTYVYKETVEVIENLEQTIR